MDPREEEQAEYNARVDYIRELEAEHVDHYAGEEWEEE